MSGMTWGNRTLRHLSRAALVCVLSLVAACADEPIQGAPSEPTQAALKFTSAERAVLDSSKIQRITLGEIDLSSGRIVTADPLTLFGAGQSFTTVVAPGKYPVYVYAKETRSAGIRVALAELRFSEVTPVSWKMAVKEGQDVSTLKADEFFGYGVDAGLGSFMSHETVKAFEADMDKAAQTIPDFSDYYSDVLAKVLEKPDPDAIVYPVPSSPENTVAIFHSGWGDGFYPSYFGFDAAGKPVTLVTTFFVLEEEG